MTVYSKRLLSALVYGAHSTSLVASGTEATIVRDMDIVVQGSGLTNFIITDGFGVRIYYVAGPLNNTVYQWRGRQVMDLGESWTFYVNGSPASLVHFRVSGYVLSP